MKIPVIRANMGIWNYYLATLSFSQIASYVKMLNSELHEIGVFEKRENITQLKEYLLSQDERLLNSLVLAVSEGEPKWIEVELHYQDEDFFNLGFLPARKKFFQYMVKPSKRLSKKTLSYQMKK
jgi:DNA sulfur modification protein DndB